MNDRARALRAALIRNFETIEKNREVREPLYDTWCARLGHGTAASKLGISVDTLAPGKRGCPYHYHHAQEEAFVVIEGKGELQIINSSAAPLTFLSISTRESPEVVEYPDSGKYLARAEGQLDGATRVFSQIARPGNGLDYWDGEP